MKLVEQGLASPKSALLMLKKFLLKIFHKKHKFISTDINFKWIKEDEADCVREFFLRDIIKRETLTCKICGHVEIKDEKIDRPPIRFHQGDITEPLGVITTKKK